MSFLASHLLPWILFALLVAVGLALWSGVTRRRFVRRLASGPNALRTSAGPLRRLLRVAAALLALLLIGIALLRPSGGEQRVEHRAPSRNLMFMLDVSASMGVDDCGMLTRLEAGKMLIRECLERRPTDRIGLMSFSGIAFPECPTTLNRTMLLERLNALEPGGLPVGGTDLQTALEEVAHLLTTNPPPGSAVILISDGDRLTSEDSEVLLTDWREDVPIHTILTGDPGASAQIPNRDLESTADSALLQDLARESGGIYLRAENQIGATLNELNQTLERIEFAGRDIAPEFFRRPLELYTWPLAIAIGFLFFRLFVPLRSRRWHALTALVFGLVLAGPIAPPAGAQSASNQVEAAFTEAEVADLSVMLLFTASDWSEASVAFNDEIRQHPTFTDWVARSVVMVEIDLPRLGLEAEERKARRRLADEHNINTYPTAVLLNPEDREELGRLHHEPDGPAAWVRRAEKILAGESTESSSPRGLKELPESVRKHLNEPEIFEVERARRLYEHALSLDRLEPDMSLASEDRFQLLNDLLRRASSSCPDTEPLLKFNIHHWRATLHHANVRRSLNVIEELTKNPQAMQQRSSEPPRPKALLRQLGTAQNHYAAAASWLPGDSGLASNLQLLDADRTKIQDLIDLQRLYEEALGKTDALWRGETRFQQNLERFVTTTEPVNNARLEEATGTISQLVEKAEIMEHPSVTNFVAALEDITLAPDPHGIRSLEASSTHILNALKHLIDEQQQQQRQPSDEGDEEEEREEDGEGDRLRDRDQEEPEEEEPEEEEQPERNEGEDDARLRDSGNDGGDLRDRLLERKSRGKKTNPGDDH